MNNTRGKLIVIDGTDGSGKATQTQHLAERLINYGYQVEIADFPQYGEKSAYLVEEYLNGKFGTAEEVGPYRASLFYAYDRYTASFKIKKWIDEGKIVIANRYVSANMGHQGGKIKNSSERKNFFNWLYHLEYEIFNIPEPDLNIILHVGTEITQKLIDNKTDREYIINGAKRDIHENDLNHLKQAEKVYLEIAQTFPNFTLVECTKNNQILSRQKINDLIWQEVLKILNSNEKQKNSEINLPSLNLCEFEIKDRKLFIERLSSTAKLPSRAYAGDAGFDLYSDDFYSLLPDEQCIIKTGIKIVIPKNFVALIWDKGGIAKQGIHTLAGVIDSGFRGEVTVNLINLSHDIYHIAPGQKVAQMLIQKVELPEIIESKIDDKTERNDSCFGSSGLY